MRQNCLPLLLSIVTFFFFCLATLVYLPLLSPAVRLCSYVGLIFVFSAYAPFPLFPLVKKT